MPTLSFATFLIVCRESACHSSFFLAQAIRGTNKNFQDRPLLTLCPLIPATAFFLGILFSLFPYDYPLLWASGRPSETHLLQTEAHLRLLHASPALIVRILHTMITVGLLGLVLKLYRASESNLLFDGGSCVLYLCGIIVYVANIVKGLRIVTEGSYGHNLVDPKPTASEGLSAHSASAGEPVLGREDNLKVLSASNTILALVLVGVLVLQAGQWYAERADEREKVKILEEEETTKKKERERSETDDSTSNAVGRKSSQKDGKKTR